MLCIVSFSQTFEWKRLSDDVVDSVYNQAVFTTNNITLKNQNYYFAYTIFPYESEWDWPYVFKPGYIYPTILSQDNQIIMADTLFLDSIYFSQNIATTFIHNDTFRVLINYPFIDSASYHNNTILRKGVPVPKTNGLLLINYSLNGSFIGYDSISLPEPIRHFSHRTDPIYEKNRRPIVADVLTNSYNEIFIFMRNNLDDKSVGWTIPILDTIGFIMKCNTSLVPDNKVISIVKSTVSGGNDDKMDFAANNDKLYLLGSISDSVIVDNMLFTADTTAGFNTFAIEFDQNLYSLKSKILPGSFSSFTVDPNKNIYISGDYNYPLNIDGRIIIPEIYADPDTFYTHNAIILKLKSDWTLENYINFLGDCAPPVIMSNEDRIFMFNLNGHCGKILLLNGDTINNPLNYQTGQDNLLLINNSSLIPFWTYNFPLDNIVHNITFNSEKMLINYSAFYNYLSGFGDTDTLVLSGDYYPVLLAQINITGLGFEEMSGSEAAPLVAYPNPASDQLFLKLPENNDFVVSVFDLSGKRQLEQFLSNGENTLNVSALNTGLYIIRAQNEKQILTGKFLKE